MSNTRLPEDVATLALRMHLEEGWSWAKITRRFNQWFHLNCQWGTYQSRGATLRRRWVTESLERMDQYAREVMS